jgi:FAD/FMN-containing dehydrogenase
MTCHGLDDAQAAQTWQPFFDWVKASPEDFSVVSRLGAGAEDSRRWWAVDGNPNMIRDAREGVPSNHAWSAGDQGECGIFLHGYDSLWLPASLLEAKHQARLVEALFAASRHKLLRVFLNKGLAGAPPEALEATRQTATNPAVAEAFALVIIADGHGLAYPGLTRTTMDLVSARRDAHDIDLAAAELRKIAPNAGSYVSESNYFNRAWQKEYWGINYSRLRAIKTKYDPGGLFFVHHGVGSEDWSADGFTRLTQS